MDRANNVNTWGHRGFLVGNLSVEFCRIAGPRYGFYIHRRKAARNPRPYQGPLHPSHERILEFLKANAGQRFNSVQIRKAIGMQKDITLKRCKELLSTGEIQACSQVRYTGPRPLGGDKPSVHYWVNA
jgi:hypothetical protein